VILLQVQEQQLNREEIAPMTAVSAHGLKIMIKMTDDGLQMTDDG
jgi:hypothetical protein